MTRKPLFAPILGVVLLLGSSSVANAQTSDCTLPPVWGEVSYIFDSCHLKEVAKGTGFSDTFSPTGANGSFDYCNTLIWRKYDTDAGTLYTYEKVRYQHYPNSEVGEYRAPTPLYNEMTNSRRCAPSDDVWTDNQGMKLSDDDMSSLAFPSRNMPHDTYTPEYWASFFNRNYDLYAWGKDSSEANKMESIKTDLDNYRAQRDSATTSAPEPSGDSSLPWIFLAFVIVAGVVALALRSSKGSTDDEPVFAKHEEEAPKQSNTSKETMSDEEFKALYKKVIKKYHPDYAQSEADKKFRNELTAKLNKAYQEKDVATLRLFE